MPIGIALVGVGAFYAAIHSRHSRGLDPAMSFYLFAGLLGVALIVGEWSEGLGGLIFVLAAVTGCGGFVRAVVRARRASARRSAG
jgi:hypothetical protein